MALNERALVALGLLCASHLGGGRRAADGGAPIADRLRELQARDPMNTVVATVLAGAALFYAAERGKNPKVTSYYDALVFVSTNLSVGYSEIFAKTPVGKLLGSALMTYGPALATRLFDAPADPKIAPASNAAVEEVVQKLDAILHELRARPVG